MSSERQFALPQGMTVEAFLEDLSAAWGFTEDTPFVVERCYLDSFDWRLFDAGGSLCFERQRGQGRLVWNSRDARQPKVVLSGVEEPPRFGWDYPPGALRSVIAPLLEMRALLPRVDLSARVRQLRLLDDDRKTVVRLRIEENYIHSDSHEANGTHEDTPIATRCELVAVRGYQQELAEVREWLDERGYLRGSPPCLLENAMLVVGDPAGAYTSKLNFDFDPQMPAFEAMGQIHQFLLGVMEANLPGVRADLDSEFLHDLRVAVRRTRSALTQVKKVFPAEQEEYFREGFAWLGQITGPTRDMHVYLLGFETYRQALPLRFQSDLEPLKSFLQAHQRSEHQTLLTQLESERFGQLLEQWASLIRGDLGQLAGEAGTMPLERLASKRIRRMAKRVFAEGEGIHAHSPPEALHELRKSCKKLRYMMEFFCSIYPKEDINGLIKESKRLLDHLGDYQDLEVQADKLRQFARQMVAEGRVPADTLLAMGMLVDGLLRRQQDRRAEFEDRFKRFADSENRKLFKALFAKEGS